MGTIATDPVTFLTRGTFRQFPNSTVGMRRATIELTAAQAEDNTLIIQMVPVFIGEVVVDMLLQTDDMDSGIAAMVIDVGDGLVADRYIDGATIGGTGGSQRFMHAISAAPSLAEFPFEYTADDTIDVKVAVAAATGVIGTIELVVWIA